MPGSLAHPMNLDTTMGGSRDRFPPTRHSVVRDAGDPDPEVRRDALEALIASYWKPVYKLLRKNCVCTKLKIRSYPMLKCPMPPQCHSRFWLVAAIRVEEATMAASGRQRLLATARGEVLLFTRI